MHQKAHKLPIVQGAETLLFAVEETGKQYSDIATNNLFVRKHTLGKIGYLEEIPAWLNVRFS
jgi:hypothetical protein